MIREEIVFPNNLRKIRMSAGMQMTELARRAKMSLSAVSKIEKGVRRLNQKQILSVCNILGCKLSDVFLKESDDIAAHWQDEMNRRVNENEVGGLKVFGAGLREIRNKIGKTISDAAKESGMTLSVYHKIEVGQRDIYERELEPLAKTFGLSVDDLFLKIAELHESGKLDSSISKTKAKKGVSLKPSKTASGDNVYGAEIYDNARKKLVPVFATPSGKGLIFEKSDKKIIKSPVSAEKTKNTYAVIPNSKRMNGILSENARVFVDASVKPLPGDLALIIDGDFNMMHPGETTTANIAIIRENSNGTMYGELQSPTEKISLSDKTIHRVIHIVFE